MAKKFETGYTSIDAAIQDGFKKIGGKGEALRVLEQGWYALQSHKEQNEKSRALREAMKNDPRVKSILENAKAQLKKKQSA